MVHMEVLVVRAALQAAHPCRVLAPTDEVSYAVDPIKRWLELDQVHAWPDNRLVLLRVVDRAQPAVVLDLYFAPDVLSVPATPGSLTTKSVAATSRHCLLAIPVDGSLPGWLMSADGAPGKSRVESSDVEEGSPLGSALGNGDWLGRAASIERSNPSTAVRLFAR